MDMYISLFKKNERMDFISILLIISIISYLISVLLLSLLSGNIVIIVCGFVITDAMLFIFFVFLKAKLFQDIPIQDDTKNFVTKKLWNPQQWNWEPKKYIRLAWVSFPLGIAFGLISFLYNIPRYFIERYLGLYELGIFSALYAISAAGRFVLNALASSATPRMVKYYALENKRKFILFMIQLSIVSLVIGIASIALVALAGKQILYYVYKPEYAAYGDIFLWSVTGPTALYYLAILLDLG